MVRSDGGTRWGQAVLVIGWIGLAGGCQAPEGTPVLFGVLDRASDVPLKRQFLKLRAIPDHPDGFDVSRDYWGPRVLESGCPIEHLEFPMEFMVWGDQDAIDGTGHLRWRLLAWETDDPTATWVSPDDAYGTTTFRWVDDPYGSWADDVDVVIDQVAP